MKKLVLLAIGLTLASCDPEIKRPVASKESAATDAAEERDSEKDKAEIGNLLDQWHSAAGEADFEGYFGLMGEDSRYLGTDATENWNLDEFKGFSKPYFDRGKAWDFTALARNIYFSESGKTAWFDELLDTHMGICRGSGVLTLQDGEWVIEHYVLSLTVPNEQVDKVTELKAEIDSSILEKGDFRGSIK